jgi:hypothetical protein
LIKYCFEIGKRLELGMMFKKRRDPKEHRQKPDSWQDNIGFGRSFKMNGIRFERPSDIRGLFLLGERWGRWLEKAKKKDLPVFG